MVKILLSFALGGEVGFRSRIFVVEWFLCTFLWKKKTFCLFIPCKFFLCCSILNWVTLLNFIFMLQTAKRIYVVLLVLMNIYIHVLVLQALLAGSFTLQDYKHSRQVIYRTLQVNSNSNVIIPSLVFF